jgi:hypothetical protein
MTRKALVVTAAAVLVALAAVTAFWLTHGDKAPPDDSAAQADTTPPSHPTPSSPTEEPTDPRVLGEIRKAYQESLAEGAPPGMLELMHGPQPGANELPPLPDPFLVPAGHAESGSSSAELPPLPPDVTSGAKPLPPPPPPTGAEKMPKEGASSELPPLPPRQ